MLSDPGFYMAAFAAVFLVGLSKGGFGGAMALMGVPLLSLVVPPVQAAAILLPVLIAMDGISLWTWRHHSDPATLRIMLPGAVAGIAIGWLTASLVTEDMIRLLVGTVALVFVLRHLQLRLSGSSEAAAGRPHRRPAGLFWGTVAGFTSFVSHAGGPPYQFYTLPLGQDPRTYTGTSVRFFAVVNAVKLIPYAALGELDLTNLRLSLVLVPLALVAVTTGAFLVKRMNARIFYPFMYAMVFLTAVKLIHDGVTGLFA